MRRREFLSILNDVAPAASTQQADSVVGDADRVTE
jgi:hypothetical protein